MGRETSGKGESVVLSRACEVLEKEFRELVEKIKLHILDENSRSVGQSVTTASLPKII